MANTNPRILRDSRLTNLLANGQAIGFTVDILFDYYRGTYLSCLEELSLTIDDETIPAEETLFELKGRRYNVSQLGELWNEYWFVLDPGKLIVLRDGGLSPEPHTVSVRIVNRVPYSGYNGNYWKDVLVAERTMIPEGGNEYV